MEGPSQSPSPLRREGRTAATSKSASPIVVEARVPIHDVDTGEIRGSRPAARVPVPRAHRRSSVPKAKQKAGTAGKKAESNHRLRRAPGPSAGAFAAAAVRQRAQGIASVRRATAVPGEAAAPVPLRLTEEETMMLCGVHPSGAAADWFRELRAPRSGDGNFPRSPRQHLPSPPPLPAAGEVPNKRDLKRQLEKALTSPATPLQVPEDWLAVHSNRGRQKESGVPSFALPVSPSGLSKNSSRSTDGESLTSSAGTESRSGAESGSSSSSRRSSASTASDIAEAGTLRRHNLKTVDRKLISQFDMLQEQRRLLSVRPNHNDDRSSRNVTSSSGREEEDAEGDEDGPSHAADSSSMTTDVISLGTRTVSPGSVQHTVVYSGSHHDAVSTHSHTSGEEDGIYDQDLGTRVIVLSLGPIAPLHRSNYEYYLRSFRNNNNKSSAAVTATANAEITTTTDPLDHPHQTWMDALPGGGAIPRDGAGADKLAALLPDGYRDLELHPTVPPYRDRQRDGNAKLLVDGRGRTLDAGGNRVGAPLGKRRSVATGPRLPPIQQRQGY